MEDVRTRKADDLWLLGFEIGRRRRNLFVSNGLLFPKPFSLRVQQSVPADRTSSIAPSIFIVSHSSTRPTYTNQSPHQTNGYLVQSIHKFPRQLWNVRLWLVKTRCKFEGYR
jgi:hypothetical protein